MRAKRVLSSLFACILLISCGTYSANAAEDVAPSYAASSVLRASGRFSMTIKANAYSKASSSFSLAAGESVTIRGAYTPSTASVDFGVTDEDGNFLYVRVTGGTMNVTIPITERGNYTLTVRNNSSSAIDVSGVVTY